MDRVVLSQEGSAAARPPMPTQGARELGVRLHTQAALEGNSASKPAPAAPISSQPVRAETVEAAPRADSTTISRVVASTAPVHNPVPEASDETRQPMRVRVAAPTQSVGTLTEQAVSASAATNSASQEQKDATSPETNIPRAPLTTAPQAVHATNLPVNSGGPGEDLGARLRVAVADSIVAEGRDRLLASTRVHTEARVTVNPAELGRVTIQIERTGDNQIRIALTTAHEDATRALAAEADDLVETLARHRIDVHEIQVREGDPGRGPTSSAHSSEDRQSGLQRDREQGSPRSRDRAPDREEQSEPRRRSRRAAEGRVDVEA
jgi:flagellar hook-length control protein FliK